MTFKFQYQDVVRRPNPMNNINPLARSSGKQATYGDRVEQLENSNLWQKSVRAHEAAGRTFDVNLIDNNPSSFSTHGPFINSLRSIQLCMFDSMSAITVLFNRFRFAYGTFISIFVPISLASSLACRYQLKLNLWYDQKHLKN